MDEEDGCLQTIVRLWFLCRLFLLDASSPRLALIYRYLVTSIVKVFIGHTWSRRCDVLHWLVLFLVHVVSQKMQSHLPDAIDHHEYLVSELYIRYSVLHTDSCIRLNINCWGAEEEVAA